MKTHTTFKLRRQSDPLARIALWQFLSFLMLLLIIWVNETLDLSALWFNTPPQPPSVFRGFSLSIAVILAATITAGTTYEQQKRVLSGLLTVCAQCRKIRITEEVWEGLDAYIAEHSLVVFSHGLCPECYARACQEIAALGTRKAAQPAAAGN